MEDTRLSWILTACYVAWGLVPTSTAGTDVLDCPCAIYSSQLAIRAIQERYLLCYPNLKHLREGFHDFIHVLPIDQMKINFLHYSGGETRSVQPWPPRS